VSLTKDFYMSKFEITNAQYATFLNATGVDNTGIGNVEDFGSQTLVVNNAQLGVTWNGSAWQPATGKATHPATVISWYGAKAFADWMGMSLPTEAQWEYACRAGTTTAWSFGNDPADLGEYAWFSGNAGGMYPIGGKKPNAWGLYDMHGNAMEWCYDRYTSNYLNLPTNIDPTGPLSGTERVARGGSWGYAAKYNRSAYRHRYDPASPSGNSAGFRVVFVP
jgi:formylglycine-generating enzyme required for sulfatase activity